MYKSNFLTIVNRLCFFFSFSGMLLEEAILYAISTSLASMVLTGAMAFYAHNKNKNIDYKIIDKFIYGLILGALIIGFIIKFIPIIRTDNFFMS